MPHIVTNIYFKGILYVYNDEYKRGTKILLKLLASDGVGLWRSVTRYYLLRLMKANGDDLAKTEKLFLTEDKTDPLFLFTKSLQ